MITKKRKFILILNLNITLIFTVSSHLTDIQLGYMLLSFSGIKDYIYNVSNYFFYIDTVVVHELLTEIGIGSIYTSL